MLPVYIYIYLYISTPDLLLLDIAPPHATNTRCNERFTKLASDVAESAPRFREWFDAAAPELEKLPLGWRELDKRPFQKLLVVRALRPDRITQVGFFPMISHPAVDKGLLLFDFMTPCGALAFFGGHEPLLSEMSIRQDVLDGIPRDHNYVVLFRVFRENYSVV